MITKESYKLLQRDLENHTELISEDCDLQILELIGNKVFKYELIEDYDWIIPNHVRANKNWFEIRDEITAGTFGGDTNRSIAWEDDGKDPGGEFLLRISFSTGAYFFGEDYDTDLFKKFFLELETFKPSFKDSMNKSLYFSKKNAGPVLQNYNDIVKKYRDQYSRESDKRKAEKLRKELAKLEGSK